MGLNSVEIILDTSESMGIRIFDSLDITKLDLAKSVLLDLFNEWSEKKCGHKLYIRYSENLNLLSLTNIENLEHIITNGKLPLSKVIDKSIKNLNTFDSQYENRVIIILTDGKNNYETTEIISSEITLYTLEIGGNSKEKSLTLSRLSEENNGVAYFYNTEEIDNMYSKVKKYFKCKKKLSAGLFSIFLMFILPVVLTFLYKGCEDDFSTNSFFTGCDSNYTKSNGMLTGCTSTSHYTLKIINKDKIADSNITTCRMDNGVKRCFLDSNKSVQAIIYDFYPNKVFILKNFASGMSKITDERKKFLKEVLKRSHIKETIKEVTIVGHTDLEQIDSNKPYFFNRNCWRHHEENNTNECLGKERAFQVEQILLQSKYHFNHIISKYDNDFFSANLNKELNNTLWNKLEFNLEKKVDNLIKKLGIKTSSTKYSYNIKEVRKDETIQNKIRNNKELYRDEFAPFRSVVLIINNE